MKYKKIFFGVFLSGLIVTPVIASPIVLSSALKRTVDFYNLANFEWPKTEQGWEIFRENSQKKSQEYYARLEQWVSDNSYKAESGIADSWSRLQKFICDHFASSDDFQYYIAYQLRRILAQTKLSVLNVDSDNINFIRPDDNDQENFVSFFLFNSTTVFDGAYVIWDHNNDNSIPLSNIWINRDLRKLAYDVYKEFENSYGNLLTDKVQLNYSSAFAQQLEFNYLTYDETKHEDLINTLITDIQRQNDLLDVIEKEDLNYALSKAVDEEGLKNDLTILNWQVAKLKLVYLKTIFVNYVNTVIPKTINDYKDTATQYLKEIEGDAEWLKAIKQNKTYNISVDGNDNIIKNYNISNQLNQYGDLDLVNSKMMQFIIKHAEVNFND
jgi:hypothetical protein